MSFTDAQEVTSEESQVQTPRTVSEYYQEMANNTPAGVIEERNREIDNSAELRATLINERDQLKEVIDQASLLSKIPVQREINRLDKEISQEDDTTHNNLQENRADVKTFDDRFGYYGKVPHEGFEDVTRAINADRLKGIAEANEPLPGQVPPPIRVADLPKEMVEERRNAVLNAQELRNSGIDNRMPLPEQTSNEVDYFAQEIENDKNAAETLAHSFINRHEKELSDIETKAVQNISEYVYLKHKGEIFVDDFELGALSLYKQKQELSLSVKDKIGLDKISFLEERVQKVQEVESDISLMLSMCRAGEKICNLIAPDEHFDSLKYVEAMSKMDQFNAYQEKYNNSRVGYSNFNFNLEQRPFSEYRDLLLNGLGALEIMRRVTNIVDFCGKRDVSNLKVEDLPSIMAYLTNSNDRYAFTSMYLAAEISIKNIMVNQLTPSQYFETSKKAISEAGGYRTFLRFLLGKEFQLSHATASSLPIVKEVKEVFKDYGGWRDFFINTPQAVDF